MTYLHDLIIITLPFAGEGSLSFPLYAYPTMVSVYFFHDAWYTWNTSHAEPESPFLSTLLLKAHFCCNVCYLKFDIYIFHLSRREKLLCSAMRLFCLTLIWSFVPTTLCLHWFIASCPTLGSSLMKSSAWEEPGTTGLSRFLVKE